MKNNKLLDIKKLNVQVEDKEIIKDLNLEISKGETIVIMGPNGSGKSSLANALMGNPLYEVSGEAIFEEDNILELSVDKRSKKGIFLSFQYPVEISGVTVSNFLRTAINSHRGEDNKIKILEFNNLLNEKMNLLHIPKEFTSRYLNEGFSGGEKKKMEILQLAMLKPKLAILDETDSGLDIDALKKVCESINIVKKDNPELTLIIITHYQRMLKYIQPDRIIIMMNGSFVKEGKEEIIHELETNGYENFRKK